MSYLLKTVNNTQVVPYFAGSLVDEEVDPAQDENENKTEVSPHSIFVFQLRSFPSLDRYRSNESTPTGLPFTMHSTVDIRANVLLKERCAIIFVLSITQMNLSGRKWHSNMCNFIYK